MRVQPTRSAALRRVDVHVGNHPPRRRLETTLAVAAAIAPMATHKGHPKKTMATAVIGAPPPWGKASDRMDQKNIGTDAHAAATPPTLLNDDRMRAGIAVMIARISADFTVMDDDNVIQAPMPA